MDHDQRFKTLIREFFADFILLFFAAWAERLDLSAPEWLDKETFPDPPEGSRHVMDLVAKVPARDSAVDSLVLVHIEIESPDRTTNLKPRMPYYYHQLRDKYQLPVLPIAIYLKVALDGIGTDVVIEETLGMEVNRFTYLYVGLPGLNGVEYVEGENWLGVALSALMRIPRERVEWLGKEALRRLTGASLTELQKFLLIDCVEAYLPLDEEGKRKLEQVLQSESYSEVRAMNQTTYEKGIEKGIEKGRQAGRMELICPLIEERFGPVSTAVRQHLEQLPIAELRRLALRIGTATTMADLGFPPGLE